jgi:hypothetical protein
MNSRQALPRLNNRKNLAVLAAIVIIILVGYAAFELYSTEGFETYDFQIKVSYPGSWQISFQGYEGGPPKTTGSHGNFTGIGNDTLIAPVYGNFQQYGAYICAWATKLDASNNTLILSIYPEGSAGPLGGSYYNTSTPNGTVMACGGVVP